MLCVCFNVFLKFVYVCQRAEDFILNCNINNVLSIYLRRHLGWFFLTT